MAAKFIKPARAFDLKVAETNVLIAFINYARETDGLGWPSLKRLQWDTGMSRRTIQYALHSLEKLEILEEVRVATPYFPTVYRFNPLADAPRKPKFEGDHRKTEVQELHPTRGAEIAIRGAKTAKRGAGAAPEPFLEPYLEPAALSEIWFGDGSEER